MRRLTRSVIKTAFVLVVAFGLLVGVRMVPGSQLEPRTEWNSVMADVPADLQELLHQVLSSSDCVTATEAEDGIRAELSNLGYERWEIASGPGVQTASCVTVTTDGPSQRITLIMALHADVRAALEEMAEHLLNECYREEQAVAKIEAVLESIGEFGWSIRSDGPVGGPGERIDEIVEHVTAGCAVYSGTGWTEDGRRVIYIAGG